MKISTVLISTVKDCPYWKSEDGTCRKHGGPAYCTNKELNEPSGHCPLPDYVPKQPECSLHNTPDLLSKPETDVTNLFYIQDTRQYVGNDLLWWGKDCSGYTTHLDKAGMFTKDEADKIVQNRDTDVMWSVEHIRSIAATVVDAQDITKNKILKFRSFGK